ncbi:transmembrane protease serine 11G-like [Bicyclus anynana]|uniref:Transmembrane protease serine 11G-like n=1 Tax=Bicyclus anynana TaxID=110368 RepID=A0ABM3M1Z2_BICAN|nr:transmembrane protease serine 11G-like [Bicyclus anynana]XP_052745519.1 transmembrane protease serine 11G-like [Bicyclus anynana]
MFMRFSTFVIALSASILHVSANDKFNTIYSLRRGNNVTQETPLTCDEVEGSVPDCSECYSCDDPVIAGQKQINVLRLELNDANCKSEEICCVSQNLMNFRGKKPDNIECGKHVPEGNPRAIRSTLRSVLRGEYPWRAWIYRTYESKPLCAATFVNQPRRTLVTAASCVDGFRAHQLQVLFDSDPDSAVDVEHLDIHENYDKVTHENDIAVLGVASVPADAQRACLPVHPAPHGTACVAVASNGFFINQAIPLQDNCAEDNKTLHSSLMCASNYYKDYTPELGAGLYCMDEEPDNILYNLVGVYLYSALEGVAAINTNITHHISWINARANEHMQLQ